LKSLEEVGGIFLKKITPQVKPIGVGSGYRRQSKEEDDVTLHRKNI